MRIPVTKEPWFTPNSRYGLNWTPCSWQGWVALGVFVLAVVGVAVFAHEPSVAIPLVVVAMVLLLVTVFLTRYVPQPEDDGDEPI